MTLPSCSVAQPLRTTIRARDRAKSRRRFMGWFLSGEPDFCWMGDVSRWRIGCPAFRSRYVGEPLGVSCHQNVCNLDTVRETAARLAQGGENHAVDVESGSLLPLSFCPDVSLGDVSLAGSLAMTATLRIHLLGEFRLLV